MFSKQFVRLCKDVIGKDHVDHPLGKVHVEKGKLSVTDGKILMHVDCSDMQEHVKDGWYIVNGTSLVKVDYDGQYPDVTKVIPSEFETIFETSDLATFIFKCASVELYFNFPLFFKHFTNIFKNTYNSPTVKLQGKDRAGLIELDYPVYEYGKAIPIQIVIMPMRIDLPENIINKALETVA